MSYRSFFALLSGLTVLTAVLLFLLHQTVDALEAHQSLSWISLAFFVALSILMFYTGKVTAASENKNLFTSAVLGFVFGKMALSLLIVIVYTREVQPESKYFVLPFFLVYILYTIFETWYLIRLGRQKPSPAHAE